MATLSACCFHSADVHVDCGDGEAAAAALCSVCIQLGAPSRDVVRHYKDTPTPHSFVLATARTFCPPPPDLFFFSLVIQVSSEAIYCFASDFPISDPIDSDFSPFIHYHVFSSCWPNLTLPPTADPDSLRRLRAYWCRVWVPAGRRAQWRDAGEGPDRRRAKTARLHGRKLQGTGLGVGVLWGECGNIEWGYSAFYCFTTLLGWGGLICQGVGEGVHSARDGWLWTETHYDFMEWISWSSHLRLDCTTLCLLSDRPTTCRGRLINCQDAAIDGL